MNEITRKLHKAGLAKLKPLIEQLVAEGADQNIIVQTTKRYTESKVNEFYKQNNELKLLRSALYGLIESLKSKTQSKAETAFFNFLASNKINFEFQYPIGPYVADYLINTDVVLELDGPQHDKVRDEKRDKYLRKLGYRVIRIPIYILSLAPETVIEEIKNLN